MAFPVVETTKTTKSIDDTEHVVSLPSGITSGDLIVIIGVFDQSSLGTITDPTGYTRIDLFAASNNFACLIYYRTADGTEGSTVTYNTQERVDIILHQAFRISQSDGSVEAEINDDDGAGDNTTDAWEVPSLTASWGSDDNLWIAGLMTNNAGAYTTAQDIPTGYTDEIAVEQDSGFIDFKFGTLRKEVATDTEGTYTWDTTSVVRAATIMVAIEGGEASRRVFNIS